MSDSPAPEAPTASVDARTFWITLVACSLPPLAWSVASLVGRGDQSAGVLLMLWGLVYALSLVWTIYAFIVGDSARSGALVLGMLAAVIVGPGSCLLMLDTFS
ncbi:hypothetical protein [Rubricoccus marinus]|uniref:Uncharacterized protein n=1 Tax=Rubricoccus marinus TaxID=716817 RepID=A0A259TXN4_9BACT|nr:hypothetical protein [Rubricoccus marinus]OZC02334.1 hypothetical protein BSZ36_04685 [Rubricoccus marinus]